MTEVSGVGFLLSKHFISLKHYYKIEYTKFHNDRDLTWQKESTHGFSWDDTRTLANDH